jgi:hypothetical protein
MTARGYVLAAGETRQPVYWASSSKDDAQSRPQKRFTLSSGFSQYQQEPFGGNFCRGCSVAAIAGIIDGIIDTALSGTACSVVSMIFPSPDTSTASKITSAEVCGSDENQYYKICRPPRQTLLLQSIIAALNQANRRVYVRQHT